VRHCQDSNPIEWIGTMTSFSSPSDALRTLAEQSGFRQTGRTDEVEHLAATFAQSWPDAVRSFEYGRSAEGRPMRALIVTRTGALTAEELRQRKIPLLMLQGGIHPGESDGKDAGFIALRELLTDAAAPGALKQIAILFVPAFNTDGHERFARWNRPNQVGPEETGWRSTAQNLNLNRDYTKADAPEMQAMLRLLNEWDPLVCADMHVTDGADFEPDISVQVEPINQGDPSLFASGVQLRDELIAKLSAQGSLPLPFYPDLYETDNPASGFLLTVYGARFSTGYFAARNRFTMLVETHSWKDYATRVRVTRNTIVGLAELVAQHGREWLALTQRADAAGLHAAGKEFALDYASGWREPTPGAPDSRDTTGKSNVEIIDFRGYAYTRKPSEISGDLVTTYDPTTPQIWRVPFRKDTEPSLTVKAPARGYLIPAAYAREIGDKLALHGIAFTAFDAPSTLIDVDVFRASEVKFSTTPFEGRMRATLQGTWQRESRVVLRGALMVPIAQLRARLIMSLLEPQAPDSFAAWGFFNGWFERKEYMEPYVAEQIAREMLEADPRLAAEFKRKLATDAELAKNPAARLEFFLRRHSSWDECFDMYPILRI
jgi:murein tripeptide amidase MpaA